MATGGQRRHGRRVLAVGAGMVLVGALGVGPAFAGSDDDDDDYYSYDYEVVCTDYSYGYYYDYANDRYEKDRHDDDWKDRDGDKGGDDKDPTTPPIVIPEIPEIPEIPDIPIIPVNPDAGLPDTLPQTELPADDPETSRSTAETDDSTTPPGTLSEPSSESPVVTAPVENQASVSSLHGTDPDEDGKDEHGWGDHRWDGPYTVTSVKCYENTSKGHRWYEHRTPGKVEATKVRTVPKGAVDTGN